MGLFDDVLGVQPQPAARKPGLFDDVLNPAPVSGPVMRKSTLDNTERGVMDMAGDFLNSILAGVGEGAASLVEAPMRAINVAADAAPGGSLFPSGRYGTASIGVPEMDSPAPQFQQPDVVRFVAENLRNRAQRFRDDRSMGGSVADAALADTSGITDTASLILEHPSVLINPAGETGGQLIPSLPAAGLGVTPMLIAQGLQAGGANAHQVEQTLIAQGVDPLEAADIADKVFAGSSVMNTLLPKAVPGGAAVESLAARTMGQKVAQAGGSRAARALVPVAGEPISEGLAGGLDQLMLNAATDQPMDQGVGQATLLEALLGLPGGIVAGGVEAATPTQPVTATAAPVAPSVAPEPTPAPVAPTPAPAPAQAAPVRRTGAEAGTVIDQRIAELESSAANGRLAPKDARALAEEDRQIEARLREFDRKKAEGILVSPENQIDAIERRRLDKRRADIKKALESHKTARGFDTQLQQLRTRLGRIDADEALIALSEELSPSVTQPTTPEAKPTEPSAPSAPVAATVMDDLAPRQPEPANVPEGTTRQQLVEAWRQAQTDDTRAAAAAQIAAFDQRQPQENNSVQAEAEEGSGQEGRQEGEGGSAGRVPGEASPDASRQVAASSTPVARAFGDAVARSGSPLRVAYHATAEDVPEDIRNRLKSSRGADVDQYDEAFYDPRGVLHVITSNIASPQRAEWVATHELAHDAMRHDAKARDKEFNAVLDEAFQNPFVAKLANALYQQRPNERGRVSTEEALAELMAAVRTGNFAEIVDRYNVEVPASQKKTLRGLVERVISRLKAAYTRLTGRKAFSDGEVYDLVQRAWGRSTAGGSTGNVAASRVPAEFDMTPSQGSRRAKIGETTITYGVGKDSVQLILIRTPKGSRGKGDARAAMTKFLAATDAKGLPVELVVAEMDNETDASKLEQFYGSVGFTKVGETGDGSPRMRREVGGKTNEQDSQQRQPGGRDAAAGGRAASQADSVEAATDDGRTGGPDARRPASDGSDGSQADSFDSQVSDGEEPGRGDQAREARAQSDARRKASTPDPQRARRSRIDEERAANPGATDIEAVVASRKQPKNLYGPLQGNDLDGLPTTFNIKGRGLVEFHGFEPAQEIARRYAEKHGNTLPKTYAKVDPERAARIAQAYDEMKHDPSNAWVRRSYEAMIDETLDQYRDILKTGLKIEFIDGADPYAASPRLAILDVIENNHLWVFPTDNGFGSSDADVSDNPLLKPTEFKISGKPALANDIFRVVHDYFGHIANGVGFRADGEENAWREHAAMYSPLARAAMTSETRGQNSWVNYGPHGEKNRTASAADTTYADQKTGLLPKWVMDDGRGDEDAPRASRQTDTPEFRRWFGNSKIVDSKGDPLGVFHGTTHDFDSFNRERANPESDFGAGFYFSNTPGDVENNYAGEGPDLTNRIERMAERISDELETDMDDARNRARAHLSGGAPNTIKAYLSIENPVVIGGKDETYFDFDYGYDEDTDEYSAEPTGKLADLMEALRSLEFYDFDSQKASNDLFNAVDGDAGLTASKVVDVLKNSEGVMYSTDDNGDIISGEVIRAAFEEAGFDGIVDNTVNEKFGSERRTGSKMAGMKKGTVHYIAFYPQQIKSATGNSGAFDKKNPSIVASRAPEFRAKKQQPDAVAVDAVHYSNTAGLTSLDPSKAGTAGAGRERRRFGMGQFGKKGGTSARLAFYVEVDDLPEQEDVVAAAGGVHPYRVRLTNLYDLDADPRDLVTSNIDATEEAISDAGFDGFVTSDQPGIDGRVAVVYDIGKKKIPVVPVDDRVMASRRQIDTPEFLRWFGDSKVVDDNGEPIVVWHGGEKFDSFRENPAALAHYASESLDVAQGYASQDAPGNAEIKPLYLRLENPLDLRDPELFEEWTGISPQSGMARNGRGMRSGGKVLKKAKAAGYDGVIFYDTDVRNRGSYVSYAFFDPKQAKAATDNETRGGSWFGYAVRQEGNSGAFDPNTPNIFASRTPGQQAIQGARARQQNAYNAVAAQGVQQGTPSQPPSGGGRFAPIGEAVDLMREKLQDRMLRLLRAQERAGYSQGGMPEMMDAYTLENLMYGRVRDKLEVTDSEVILPLQNMLKRSGLTMDQFQDYLLARHAPERNAQIAKINPAVQDGGAGISTADANAIMAGTAPGPYSKKPLTADDRSKAAAAAKLVDELRKRTLDTLESSQQITPQMATTLRATYKNYVPLRGIDADPWTRPMRGTGKGLSVAGKAIRRALGRGEGNLAENLIGEMVGDYQRAVTQAEKARVTQAFLKFAIANPMPDMFTVEPVDLEWKYSEATGEAYLGVKSIADDASRAIIVPHNNGHVRIRFEDERLRDAMMNMGAEDMGSFVRIAGAINRWRSAVLTRYNPAFAPVNVLRDFQFGMAAVSAEKGAKRAAEAVVNYMPAMLALIRDSRKPRGDSSKPTASKTWDDWAREYAESGAKTGITKVEDVTDLQKRLSIASSTIMQIAAQGRVTRASVEAVRRAGEPLLDVIEDVNDATENALRLAVYVAERKAGVTQQAAAKYAKDVTINFNRKGHYGSIINAVYLFYNASIQGTHAVARVMRKPGVITFLAGLAGFQAMLAASLMDDEDKDGVTTWDMIPDYVKRTSLVIPLHPVTGRKGDYFALPMPYGFNLFPYSGGRVAQWVKQGARPTDNSLFMDMTKSTTEAFSPVPLSEGYNALFGDTVGSLMQLAQNRDDLGRPIANENEHSPYKVPAALQGRPDTPRIYQSASELMAKAGGGDLEKRVAPVGYLDVAPEQLEYMVDFMAGGLGNISNKSARWWDLLDAGALNNPVDFAGNAPIVSRMLGGPNEARAVADRYYGERGELTRGLDRLKDRVRSGDDPDQALADLTDEVPALRGVEFDRYKRDGHYEGVGDVRKGQIKMTETGSPKLKPSTGSPAKALKDSERAIEDINRNIRSLRDDDLTLGDVVRILGISDAKGENVSDTGMRFLVDDLGLPEGYNPADPASNRVIQRAIRHLQEDRLKWQKGTLTTIEAARNAP